MWRAWTGAAAFAGNPGNFDEASRPGVFLELVSTYCRGPVVLLVMLLMARYSIHSRKWLPVLVAVGVLAGAWGIMDASFFACSVGHELYFSYSNPFSTLLRISWGLGMGTAVVMLMLQVRNFRFASQPARL